MGRACPQTGLGNCPKERRGGRRRYGRNRKIKMERDVDMLRVQANVAEKNAEGKTEL